MKAALESVARLKKPETEAVLVAVSCNKCGNRVVVAEPSGSPTGVAGGGFPDDYHVIPLSGGYGDSFPSDLCTLRIVVCGGCLKEWCDSFVIPAEYVWTGPGSHGNAREATHSETYEEYIIENGWARPADLVLSGEFDSWSYEEGDGFPAPGVYRHFKGGLYEVLDYARHIGTREPMVVYQALYGVSKVWVRPARLWADEVERDGYKGPRFVPLETP